MTQRLTGLILCFSVIFILNACVEEKANEGRSNENEIANSVSDNRSFVYSAGFEPSSNAYSTTTLNMFLCVHGVFQASIQSGGTRVVTTGTLTESDSKPFQFFYENDNDKRLQINFSNENYLDCYIEKIQGNFSQDAFTFLNGAHVLHFRFANNTSMDLSVSSEKTVNYYNSFYTIKLLGSLIWNEMTMTINLTLDGQGYFESSFGGSEKTSDDNLTGTIESADYSISIDETVKYRLIVVGSESASSNDRWINNSWNIDNDNYQLVGYTHASFKNGSPSQIDTEWKSSGDLTKNSSTIGYLKLDYDQVYIYFNLLVEQETYEIQKFQL